MHAFDLKSVRRARRLLAFCEKFSLDPCSYYYIQMYLMRYSEKHPSSSATKESYVGTVHARRTL